MTFLTPKFMSHGLVLVQQRTTQIHDSAVDIDTAFLQLKEWIIGVVLLSTASQEQRQMCKEEQIWRKRWAEPPAQASPQHCECGILFLSVQGCSRAEYTWWCSGQSTRNQASCIFLTPTVLLWNANILLSMLGLRAISSWLGEQEEQKFNSQFVPKF